MGFNSFVFSFVFSITMNFKTKLIFCKHITPFNYLSTTGLGNVRPAGHIRPTKILNVARVIHQLLSNELLSIFLLSIFIFYVFSLKGLINLLSKCKRIVMLSIRTSNLNSLYKIQYTCTGPRIHHLSLMWWV